MKISNYIKISVELKEFRGFKQKVKVTWKRFRSLVFIYLLFVFILTWSHYHYSVFVDLFETNWHWPKGFIANWQSSLFQDLIFFGATGFLGLVLSTRLPTDENYRDRVEAIANALRAGERVKNYVSQEIKQLTVYHEQSETRLTIEDVYDSDEADYKKVAKIFCERTYELTNMCADEVRNLEVNARIIPGPSQKNDYGYVKELSYEYQEIEKTTTETKKIIVGSIVPLDATGYHHPESVNLRGNGVVTQTFAYGIFCPMDADALSEDHCFSTAHPFFTANYTLVLTNHSKLPVYYEFSYPDRQMVVPGQPLRLLTGNGMLPGVQHRSSPSVEVVVDRIYMHRADTILLHLYTYDRSQTKKNTAGTGN